MRTPGLTIFPSIISWINEAILAVKWFVVSGKRGQLDYRGVTLRRHEDEMKCGFCTSQLVAFDATWRDRRDRRDTLLRPHCDSDWQESGWPLSHWQCRSPECYKIHWQASFFSSFFLSAYLFQCPFIQSCISGSWRRTPRIWKCQNLTKSPKPKGFLTSASTARCAELLLSSFIDKVANLSSVYSPMVGHDGL